MRRRSNRRKRPERARGRARSRFIITVAASLLLWAGCGSPVPALDPPVAAATPQPGDWLTFADMAEPGTLDCLKTSERSARQICRLVADSLIDFDQRHQFIPRLAESFIVSPDRLQITFRLRAGVRWHDGLPFSARDVLFTVAQIRKADPNGELFRINFGPMTDVASPDDRTIVARYAEPFAGALTGWRELLIMPAAHPVDPTTPSPLDRAPVGTGPFRFVQWEPQTRIVLDANTDYFGGRPLVDRYVHRFMPGLEAMKSAAEAGEVDVAALSSDWLRNPAANSAKPLPFRAVVSPTSLMEMIYWNVAEPRGLFRDARVRRAMTLLLDREGYVTRIHQGVYRTAATLIDPSLWGGDATLKPVPHDPAQAARLLDEAGIKDRDGDGVRDTAEGPFAFSLLFTGSSPDQREVAALFERAAAAVGVRVQLTPLEWSIFRPRAYARQFEAAIFRWRLEPLPDPFAYFHSSQTAAEMKNLGGWRSDEFDRLAEQHRATFDEARAASLLAQMQIILDREQPVTVIAVAGAVTAIHKRFRTPEITASGIWNWYPGILSWWVPPGERKHP